MKDIIEVRYLWNNDKKDGDLVCELTEFMDKYLLHKSMLTYCKTYLYNDICIFSSNNILQIAFRYPGATRGGILLERLSPKTFEIKGIHFNMDSCFSKKLGCYDEKLKDDVDIWIGKVLDFSKVTLINNFECYAKE